MMMTVICFLEKPLAVLHKIFRVLVNGGYIILGFIEKDGEIATQYRQEKIKGKFLRFARFRTVDVVVRFAEDAGFSEVSVARRARGFCVMNGRKPYKHERNADMTLCFHSNPMPFSTQILRINFIILRVREN